MTEENALSIVESTKLSKSDLLSEMRKHQVAYAKYASELKKITAEEEQTAMSERQYKRLAGYKLKYKFYAKEDGSTKEIDWVEVEKLITTSLANIDPSTPEYGLGFSQDGYEGLGCSLNGSTIFYPMVEDEIECKRYAARETRKKEFKAKQKG